MTLVKIAYVSNTGNTEGISEHLEDAFEALDMEVVREVADDIDETYFNDADIAIVTTFTDGDGEVPFDFEDFYEDVTEEELGDVIFGVVGSGDSQLYPDYFCQAAFLFEKALEEAGATKGVATLTIENDADDEDVEKIQAFATSLAKSVNN